MRRKVAISGVDLEIVEKGAGRPLLFLHAGEGLWPGRPWLDKLSETYRVIAPFHPGYGGSAVPDWFGTVDDLAYLYLDLTDHLQLNGAVNLYARGNIDFDNPFRRRGPAKRRRDIGDRHAVSQQADAFNLIEIPALDH